MIHNYLKMISFFQDTNWGRSGLEKTQFACPFITGFIPDSQSPVLLLRLLCHCISFSASFNIVNAALRASLFSSPFRLGVSYDLPHHLCSASPFITMAFVSSFAGTAVAPSTRRLVSSRRGSVHVARQTRLVIPQNLVPIAAVALPAMP